MSILTYDASVIAEYFLFKAQTDEELLSNLKLQKLVYYAQGLHLALEGTSLFDEDIEAWEYGPVVPRLYHTYKRHGSGAIPSPKSFNPEDIDLKTRDFLDEVYSVFGQYTALRLMDFTHEDQCWLDAYPNGIITHEAMQKDLRKYLKTKDG